MNHKYGGKIIYARLFWIFILKTFSNSWKFEDGTHLIQKDPSRQISHKKHDSFDNWRVQRGEKGQGQLMWFLRKTGYYCAL